MSALKRMITEEKEKCDSLNPALTDKVKMNNNKREGNGIILRHPKCGMDYINEPMPSPRFV
ncbi:MAG: hypothetical protein WAK17_04605 [Candidatus Nitrosopolaris sp.]|jgi:hypothetical protein